MQHKEEKEHSEKENGNEKIAEKEKGSRTKTKESELQEIAEKEKEIAELKETLQRVQAEFENSCKRLEKQKKEFVEFANSETIKELLPLLDSFHAAIEKMQKQENFQKQEALQGIMALQKQLLSIMQRHGLEEIKSAGEKFNPMLHEAVLHESNPKKGDETVLEELQKGFLLKGKLLRAAKVKINKLAGESKK